MLICSLTRIMTWCILNCYEETRNEKSILQEHFQPVVGGYMDQNIMARLFSAHLQT